MHTPLRIGTRGSQLALWQARAVATRLEAAGVDAELVIIKTSGDRLQVGPAVGGRRQAAVRQGNRRCAARAARSTLAVHSAKDMPARAARRVDHRGRRCRGRIHETRSCCQRVTPQPTWPQRSRNGHSRESGPSSIRRTAQLRPRFSAARLRADPRERRHPASEARRGRVRCADPRGRGPAAARLR